MGKYIFEERVVWRCVVPGFRVGLALSVALAFAVSVVIRWGLIFFRISICYGLLIGVVVGTVSGFINGIALAVYINRLARRPVDRRSFRIGCGRVCAVVSILALAQLPQLAG